MDDRSSGNPTDATPRELELLPGHRWAYPYDLNDQGIAVGVSDGHAALWNTATGDTRDLGSLLPEAGQSVANGINDVAQVVLMAGGENWVLDISSNRLSRVPNTTFGYGISINDQAQAVGMSFERAALWNPIAE